MRLYDAHNHLQDPRLNATRDEAFGKAMGAGVLRMVVNGTRESDWDAVQNLALQHPEIVPAIGLHPWHVRERSVDWKERLVQALGARPRAIGEIGLDRWIREFNLREQEEVFVFQLRLGAEHNAPVTIHCLKAWGALMDILQREPRPSCGFLLHSYGGSADLIRPLAKLGAYFSCSGYFAHERKARQREVFRQVPFDRLLVETDAPDMVPPESLIAEPFSDEAGKAANHPANIRRIYEFVAELRGITVEKLAEQMEENFKRLFGQKVV